MKNFAKIIAIALIISGCSHNPSDNAEEPSGPVVVTPTEPTTPTVPGTPTAPKGYWQPGPISSFQIFHFDGLSDFKKKLQKVDVITIELEQAEEAGQAAIAHAHAQGTKVICYTSMGYEDFREDADKYPRDAMGKEMTQWDGEAWGDPRKDSLLSFQGRRMDRAKALNCDGFELDNIDAAWNKKENGFNITPAENIAALKKFAELGHSKGLGMIQKNAPDMSAALAPYFQGLWSEECQHYSECGPHAAYKGKPVALVEYSGSCKKYDWAVCQKKSGYFK